VSPFVLRVILVSVMALFSNSKITNDPSVKVNYLNPCQGIFQKEKKIDETTTNSKVKQNSKKASNFVVQSILNFDGSIYSLPSNILCFHLLKQALVFSPFRYPVFLRLRMLGFLF
jgi:hypothetical protein